MAETFPGNGRATRGADKGYDVREFVAELREMNITPNVAQNNTNRRSAIDQRTTHHEGYRISLRNRSRIDEVFGWMKTVGLLRKLRHRRPEHVGWVFTFTAAVYNLVRIRNLNGRILHPKYALGAYRPPQNFDRNRNYLAI